MLSFGIGSIPPQLVAISRDEVLVGYRLRLSANLVTTLEENRRLKNLVADLTLDKQILQDAYSKKL